MKVDLANFPWHLGHMHRKTTAFVRSEFFGFTVLVTTLAAVLVFQFHRSFLPGETLRLNDGPLAAQLAQQNGFPGAFGGIWQDLNRLGSHGGTATLSPTYFLRWLLGAVGFAKFHAPLSILILGICAWFGFRALKFRAEVCVIGALASALNSNFFSNACWGLASRPLTLAMMFLAVAAWVSTRVRYRWVRVVLSGFAVGMGVTESADVGVIFSLIFAAFVVMHRLSDNTSSHWRIRLAKGVGLVFAVAGVAMLASIHLLIALLNAGVNPAKTAGIRFETDQQHWDWATQWSLPKAEIPRVFIAGLFGYLMETEDGKDYWGSAGRSPNWQPGTPGGARYSGAGEYAGVSVCLLCLYGLIRALRCDENPLSVSERRMLWFWFGIALLSLGFALGKHAPFYRLIVSLPYFSSTRNPIKWMHGCHFALLMMLVLGLEALAREYLQSIPKGKKADPSLRPRFVARSRFRTAWGWMTGALTVVSLCAAVLYSVGKPGLEQHLAGEGVKAQLIPSIAATSVHEVWVFAFVLTAGMGLLWLIVTGKLNHPQCSWAWVSLAILLLFDLMRANSPWVVHYNYAQRHTPNHLWQSLARGPMPQRVTVAPLRHPDLAPLDWLQSVYQAEWLQHQFPLFNIPSLDVIQDPRPSPDFQQYASALDGNLSRLWELTSTRYILGLADPFASLLNRLIDPERQRFRQVTNFSVGQNRAAGFPPQPVMNGVFGLTEFQGAMPRANIFGRWAVTEDVETLQVLANPTFEPTNLVLVASANPVSQPSQEELATVSNLVVKAYSPKRIELASTADGPTVVMLNDKWHADWKVSVDGAAAPLLRCNYLMRGVLVPAGQHRIDFRFAPSRSGFYLSLSMMIFVLGWVAYDFGRRRG